MYSGIFERRSLVPVLVGAALSLFFLRSGFFSFFFLVPLGFLAYRFEYRIAWNGLFFAVIGNLLLVLGFASAGGLALRAVGLDILYFTVMAATFVWIIAPPPSLSLGLSRITRFMAGSCMGALLFIGVFLRLASSPGFLEYLSSLTEALASSGRSSGSSFAQIAFLSELSAETVLNTMKSIMLRGGSLLSALMMFFFCNLLSRSLAQLSLRERAAPSLIAFRVNPSAIWVLSVSLLLLVLSRVTKMEIPEIILWNVLIFCVILYLAQGLGILQFFFARFTLSPFLKLTLTLLFIFILFSPVINMVLLVSLVFLGIAENWVPFRVNNQGA